MMKNLVIAGYSGYNSLEKVENFIESFLKVKLPHDEIIICFSGEETEINAYLDKHLIKQVKLEDVSESKYVTRFKWFSEVIDTEVYDKVLCADIRDVVFQYNPFTWMFDFKKRPLLVCDEGMKHKDEPWNQRMMQCAFPDLHDEMMNLNVFNVGVLGGDAYDVKYMCKRVFERSLTAPFIDVSGGEKLEIVPDQVAFSILVNLESPNKQNQHLSNNDSWCLTCASVEYSTRDVKVVGGKICNKQGQEYCLVHQYDRWKNAIGLNYDFKTQKFSIQSEEFFKISFECGKHKTLETINTSRVSLVKL